MQQNVSDLERIIRTTLGAAILILGILKRRPWGILGLIPLSTGLTGFCPAWAIFGISTRDPQSPLMPQLPPSRASRPSCQ